MTRPPKRENPHRSVAADPARASLLRAIACLVEAATDRLARHPNAHQAEPGDRRAEIDLVLRVPLGGSTAPRRLDELADQASEELDRELAELIERQAALRPGHVFCLRCVSAECDHGFPNGPREVFVGYGATGLPQFDDFAQWLLACHDERIDRLYAAGGRRQGLVTRIVSGQQLTDDLLPAFRPGDGPDIRILGQVAAGWFPLEGSAAEERRLALSLQVISSRTRERRNRDKGGTTRRQLRLNVVGAGPGGAPLRSLDDKLGAAPWAAVSRWGQRMLGTIERSQHRLSPAHLSARVEGVLVSIARRLEQGRRAEDRRTNHAEDRHQGGERPTRMATADLGRATADQILKDTLRDTWIVLGERGRAHVFGVDGRLVTSLRDSTDSIARKRSRGRWRQANDEEIAALREKACSWDAI